MERLIFPDFMKVCSSIFVLYLSIRYIVLVQKSLLSKEANDNQNKKSKTKQAKDKNFEGVLLVIKMILISLVFLLLMFFFKDNLYYRLMIFGAYVFIFIFYIIFGTKTIKLIVSRKSNLSRENVTASIYLFGMILFFLRDVEWNYVWNIITENDDYMIADILHAVLLVSLYFLYIIVIFSSVTFIFKDLLSFLIKKCKAIKVLYNKISRKIMDYDPLTFKFRVHIKSSEKLNMILNIILDVLFVIPGSAILIFIFFLDILDSIFHELLQLLKLVSKLEDDIIISRAFKVAIVLSLIIVVAINRYHPIFIYKEQSTSVLEFVASAILLPLIFEWIQSVSKRKSTKNDLLR